MNLTLNLTRRAANGVRAIALVGCMLTVCGTALAQHGAPSKHADSPYAAYEFLIGDWDTVMGGASMHQSYSWGPNKSYIRATTYTAEGGKAERLHFEGILVWNGATKNLDYLFAVEPGTNTQEKGVMYLDADGSIVREVTMTHGDGGIDTFRQTFRKSGEGHVMTAAMHKIATGWEPTFPGSDKLDMTKRH
jgi:hypothetical protein